MNKRQFLKTSGAFIAASALPGLASGEQKAAPLANWSGNYTYQAQRREFPRGVEEIQEIIKKRSRVKALGARHSFNTIADSTGDQISLKHFDQISIDAKSRTVTVGGGVTYSDLGPYLDRHGLALHNLASLPHISIPGACATATHGSGNMNGNLATAVTAMEFITGDGALRTLSSERDGERFRAAVVHLGALGVVTKITLRTQPTYQVWQVVYENLSIDHLEKHLNEIFASGYSVSLFTDWQNHRMTQVWIKSRVEPGALFTMAPEFYGAKRATRNLHPITGHSAESCTQQLGVPGPWYDRLPHFRINAVPSSGHELQTEYFVPRERGYEAILAVERLKDRITPLLFVTELRTIDADDLWMSTCYKRPSMTVHFTWKPEWPAVKDLLPAIEEKLAPFEARPHWAKMFTMPPSRLQSLYEKMPDYRARLESYDPSGKFRNEFLNRYIFAV